MPTNVKGFYPLHWLVERGDLVVCFVLWAAFGFFVWETVNSRPTLNINTPDLFTVCAIFEGILAFILSFFVLWEIEEQRMDNTKPQTEE